MRKLILLTFAIVVACSTALAADVDLTKAQSAAKSFMSKQVANGRLKASAANNLKLVKAETSVAKPTAVDYYIFNADKAYVVVAGDDQAPEILMYGEEGTININNIPPAMQWLLNKYKYQIDGLKAGTLKANNYSPKATAAVAPLTNANWDQGEPYWNHTPTSGSTHTYTGCPATSLSMCFYIYKWPKTYPALSKVQVSGGVTASALSEKAADWDNMLDEYTGPTNYDYDNTQAEAVSWLMRYVGQACNMQYTTSGSGAYDPDILEACHTFGYTDAQLLTLTTGYAGYNQNYTDAQWNTWMLEELHAGRPIEYLASDPSAGGHAFNVFGCDSNGKFYVNWGWSGEDNGYCTLHNFTTGNNSTGQGGGSYTFNYGEAMIIGIAPPAGALGPQITVNPASLAFEGYVGDTYTKTFTVTGANLEGNITITKQGASNITVNPTSITATNAANGVQVTVTYKPTAAGNSNATITLASTNAESVTVNVTGTAEAKVPTIKVDPASISMVANLSSTVTKTINVTGLFLTNNITVTLNDNNNVFSVTPTTITAANAVNGVPVTVSFNSATEGNFTGSLTFASNGAESKTVALTAQANDGGTASDAYLNIANYATIDEAGWNTSLVNKMYEYKEYDSEGVAWLTLPMYGAFVGAKYSTTSNTISSGHPQAWIETSVTQSSQCGQTSWSATDIYLGSSNYFTSTTAEAVGTNSRNSTTEKAVTFYVTNTTAVKLYASQRSNSTTYPTTLKIYECTVNGDGTLTSGSSTVKNGSLTTSGAGSISLTELDASKVYKVVASQARGYLYEIGFQTPISKPTLTASPTGIDFIAEPGETITETITVTGARLTEDVTVTLTDENGVYTLDKSSISIAEATNGATVTVTFNAPQAMGSYRGQATFTSGQASAKTVFYGAVGEKGSAYSNYLDIAQYQTIATGNWYDGIFANAYKWTEREDDECAWLTVPAALPYFAWNYNDQNWCGVSSNSNGGWYGHQWTATDVFQGYEYFKRADLSDENGDYAHMMGGDESNSTSNTTIFYGIYNVTNCTQVKAYAYNNGATSTYPAFIQIYELTENADGTLTQSDTRTDIQTSSTSGAVTMTSAELDPNKIYFVAVGGYRGFTYEVAFKTPLVITEATLAEIEKEGYPGNRFKIKDELVAVFADADRGLLWCKDQGNVSIDPTSRKDGQVDYMREVTKEQAGEWDQSNWVMLQFPEATEVNSGIQSLLKDAVGKRIAAGSITGRYIDDENYAFEVFPVNNEYTLVTGTDAGYVKNLYCPANFLESNLNLTEESTGYVYENINTGTRIAYFFMNPKVQEVCEITYAVWDGEKFVLPAKNANGTMNDTGIPGAIAVDWSINQADSNVKPEKGQGYRFVAVVHRTNGSNYGHLKSYDPIDPMEGVDASKNLMIAPLNFTGADDQIVTEIDIVFNDGSREVVGVEYVNVAGMVSDKPFQGINIVVTRYSDGSKTTSKKVFK